MTRSAVTRPPVWSAGQAGPRLRLPAFCCPAFCCPARRPSAAATIRRRPPAGRAGGAVRLRWPLRRRSTGSALRPPSAAAHPTNLVSHWRVLPPVRSAWAGSHPALPPACRRPARPPSAAARPTNLVSHWRVLPPVRPAWAGFHPALPPACLWRAGHSPPVPGVRPPRASAPRRCRRASGCPRRVARASPPRTPDS